MARSEEKIPPPLQLRPATNADGAAVKQLVFAVLAEFGLEPAPETTDADLEDLAAAYHQRGGCFDVLVTADGEIAGSVGVYPLADRRKCELRKMYLAAGYRGHGAGRRLLDHALDRARALGFDTMILETNTALESANRLYRSYGFAPLTGDAHLSLRCDQAYSLDLT